MMRPRLFISFLLVLMLMCAANATAQDVRAKQSQKERLEREIAQLDKQLKQNASRNADAMSRLELVRSKMEARRALVAESEQEIAVLDTELKQKQAEVDAVQAQLDTMTAYYRRLIRSAYKNRDARVWYMYILASENVAQGMRRYSFFKNLSSKMSVQAARIQESRDTLVAQKARLEALYSKANALRDSRLKELDKLKAEEKEIENLTAVLKRNKSKYQKELLSKRYQAESLEREIKRMISRSVRGSKGTATKKKNIDYTLADQFVSNRGKLPWPAEGPLVGRFGKQYHSVFKSLELPMNNGVSIALSPDSEIKAVFNGTVSQITVLPGYHQCVLVQHGNYFTLYAKMKNVKVKQGDKVATGQVLGTVDTIGSETVFHFEIWDDNTLPQNPEDWLRPR